MCEYLQYSVPVEWLFLRFNVTHKLIDTMAANNRYSNDILSAVTTSFFASSKLIFNAIPRLVVIS